MRRAFPPSRLLWIALVGVGGLASLYLAGLGLRALVLLPLVAASLDLLFQRVRFDRLRAPDSAMATGLFIALLLPPTAPLVLLGGITVLAVTAKHVLRSGGHPWFNPAALAVVGAILLFRVPPAWWVAAGPYSLYAAAGAGCALIALRASRWRLPTTFLLFYGAFNALQHVLFGATADPRVLLLGILDPTTVFFVLFMVPEPRTAPTDPRSQVVYAGAVGILAAFSPLISPTGGLLIALLAGNGLALGLRWRASRVTDPTPRSFRPDRPTTSRRRPTAAPRWTLAPRVASGVISVLAVAALTVALPSPAAAPLLPGGSGSGGTTLGGCVHDNSAIPASTLSQLHQILGPSVIRSYDSSTGVVIFYDPVNHVTVTETDLYEDFGYAEFNGDDYAVNGCSG